MTEMSTLLQHHSKGKVRILAIAWNSRSATAADVPTMIEQGVKDFTAASYVGVLTPAKTPPEIVATLEKAIAEAGAAVDQAGPIWTVSLARKANRGRRRVLEQALADERAHASSGAGPRG